MGTIGETVRRRRSALRTGLTGRVLDVGLVVVVVVFFITMATCGVLNVSIERIAYRPLRNAPRLAPLITAVGMSFFLESVLFLWKGPSNVAYPAVLPSVSF